MRQFMRGAAAGGVGAAAMMTAAVALAGTGVGGVFNLGKLNTVNVPTRLSGTTSGVSLVLTNNSTAVGSTALSLTVPDGRPPFSVSSPIRVNGLNADRVDGYHASQLARLGKSAPATRISSIAAFTEQASVTITAPTAGLVHLTGQTMASTTSDPACAPCYAHARITEPAVPGRVSPVLITGLDNTSGMDGDALAPTFVFPATAGSHTYKLETGSYSDSGTLTFDNSVLTAVYVPFGPSGQAGSLGVADGAAAPAKAAETMRPDGSVVAR